MKVIELVASREKGETSSLSARPVYTPLPMENGALSVRRKKGPYWISSFFFLRRRSMARGPWR